MNATTGDQVERCGETMENKGTEYRCELAKGHGGPHADTGSDGRDETWIMKWQPVARPLGRAR